MGRDSAEHISFCREARFIKVNLSKLRVPLSDPSGHPTAQYKHCFEVANRLESALGEWLTLDECLALVYILANNTIVYKDEFVGNDLTNFIKLIGFVEAAAIASCFHQYPNVDWQYIHRLHLGNDSKPLYLELGDILLKRIWDGPITVQRVE